MIKKIDHIGIAVRDLDAAVAVWEATLGMRHVATEVVEGEKVRVAKLAAGDDVVELLEPMSDDSPISGFLARRGGGIHHICLEVDDIETTLARLKAAGLRLIDEAPKRGAGGAKIAFVHPKSASGVLIELSEKEA